MKTSSLAALPGLLLLLGAQGCAGDGEVDAGAEPDSRTCRGLVPSPVVERLGWDDAEPVRDAGSCTLAVPQGTVTVARVPVVAEGDDTELTATSTTFGERCAELDDGEPAEVVDWFGLNIAGCAVDGSPPAGTDVLVDVVVRLGVIAEITITSDEAVPEETVRSALADLAVAATREL